MLNIDTRTADKKRPIPLFVEQSQFEQFTPTQRQTYFFVKNLSFFRKYFIPKMVFCIGLLRLQNVIMNLFQKSHIPKSLGTLKTNESG